MNTHMSDAGQRKVNAIIETALLDVLDIMKKERHGQQK
jgi:hypothetical protein